VRGSCTESSEMGWMMAEKILARGGREILAEMYNGC